MYLERVATKALVERNIGDQVAPVAALWLS